MTTLQPPSPPTPVDPYPNKAIATAVTALVTAGIQWAASGEFQLDQEGITVLGGALATVLVYVVSNWKKLGGGPKRAGRVRVAVGVAGPEGRLVPWKASQVRAIAAKMRRDGKSPAEISAFFHAHGHGRKRVSRDHPMMKQARKRK